MGLLDKLFGKKGTDEEPIEPPRQTRHDHHAPINFDEWGGDEEPLLDLEMVDSSPDRDPFAPNQEKENACQQIEGEALPVVLTVMAHDGDHFEGGDLLREFTAAGLHLGKDGLYHLYPAEGVKAPLFSVSNVLNPGVFKAKQMMELKTRGLVLFFQLPAAHSGKACFTALVEHANRFATALGGEIMNAERRKLNNHILQQMQDQVIEFEHCRELERRKAEQNS